MFARVGVLCVGLIALAMPARAQQAPNGEAVFKQSCATCHREGQNDAPTRDALRQMTPESIYNAQTLGRMILQASALSDDERKAVAVFLSGRPFAPPSPLVCLWPAFTRARGWSSRRGRWSALQRLCPMPTPGARFSAL